MGGRGFEEDIADSVLLRYIFVVGWHVVYDSMMRDLLLLIYSLSCLHVYVS